jgi:transcriptional regulator with XRE-family HTH domain
MTKLRGNPFKAKREELGLTQQRAATALDVAIATWCRWENGISNPLPEHARLLELLDYYVNPGQSPKPRACEQSDTMPLSSDQFQEHLTICRPCQLRIEFLHNEMDRL